MVIIIDRTEVDKTTRRLISSWEFSSFETGTLKFGIIRSQGMVAMMGTMMSRVGGSFPTVSFLWNITFWTILVLETSCIVCWVFFLYHMVCTGFIGTKRMGKREGKKVFFSAGLAAPVSAEEACSTVALLWSGLQPGEHSERALLLFASDSWQMALNSIF